MDPGFAVGLGVLWVLFNIFARKGRRPDQKERFPGSRPQVPPRVYSSAFDRYGPDPEGRSATSGFVA